MGEVEIIPLVHFLGMREFLRAQVLVSNSRKHPCTAWNEGILGLKFILVAPGSTYALLGMREYFGTKATKNLAISIF